MLKPLQLHVSLASEPLILDLGTVTSRYSPGRALVRDIIIITSQGSGGLAITVAFQQAMSCLLFIHYLLIFVYASADHSCQWGLFTWLAWFSSFISRDRDRDSDRLSDRLSYSSHRYLFLLLCFLSND